MAALIKEQHGLETELIRSGGGEFTVWVGEKKVAGKTWTGFPSDEECLSAVAQNLN